MSDHKPKYRFESEVHLGLLSIILLLMFMSVVSNYVLFNARVQMQESTAAQLRSAAVAISRTIRENDLQGLNHDHKERFRQQFELSGLIVVPSEPTDSTTVGRARWLSGVLSELPVEQAPEVADRLLRADLKRLLRGEGAQFFMVLPVPLGPREQLLLLTAENHELAYLQDAGRVILWLGFAASAIVALVYLLLSQFIFRPFRGIRAAAHSAGRQVDGTENEADQVVEEYRRVIADLKQKETELIELNEAIQLRADSVEQFNQYLLSSIDSGIMTVGTEGEIKSINNAARSILGGPNDLLGKPIALCFDKASAVLQQVELALRGASLPNYKEVCYNRGDGSEGVLGTAISPIRDANQQIIGASVLINDLTELNTLRRQVEQKDRLEALGEMAAGLAHQLRNSVGAISGYGALLRRRMAKLNEPPDAAEALLAEANEAKELVSKFLTFARPLRLQREAVSLSELVRAVVDGFTVRPDCSLISISTDFRQDLQIEADSVLLKQVIGNLIDNSVKAYQGGEGEIEIELHRENGSAILLIKDHACGIPEDQLEKIFTPFYSSRPSGTGLGLPIASRIVDLHGGRITVQSVVGQGTMVRVMLPIEAVPELSASSHH
jgi:PAS domain S-box-containing protein